MSHEGAMEAFEGVSPFDMLFDVFGKGEQAKKFREKFTEFFANTPLADSIVRTSFAKSLRFGATILFTAIGGASPQTIDAGKYLDAAKQVRSVIYEAQMTKAKMVQDRLARPGLEQHQQTLTKVGDILSGLRTKTKFDAQSPEKAAFDIVIANILDGKTSALLREMLAKADERDTAQGWLQQQAVKIDFSELHSSPIMQDDALRMRFVESIHEIYAMDEIAHIQKLVGDSRLLYYYECIYRAIFQPEYRAKNEARIRSAAHELLEEGNLELIVKILQDSKAIIPAAEIARMVAQYVPDSQFAHSYGERVPLTPESDEGLARLQS